MGLQRTTWLASRVETLFFSDIMIYSEPLEEEDPGQIRYNKISFEAIFTTICFLYYMISLILPSYLTRLIEVFIGKHENYLWMFFLNTLTLTFVHAASNICLKPVKKTVYKLSIKHHLLEVIVMLGRN